MCVCSVRYHTLHPNYIHERLERLGSSFELRLLLVLVDAVSVCVSHQKLTVSGCPFCITCGVLYRVSAVM